MCSGKHQDRARFACGDGRRTQRDGGGMQRLIGAHIHLLDEIPDATEREAYGEDPYFEKLYEWYTAFGDEMEVLAPGRVHTYDNSEHSPLHLSAASID